MCNIAGAIANRKSGTIEQQIYDSRKALSPQELKSIHTIWSLC